MPKLRMLRGPQIGEEFDLSEDAIHIGRGRKNEIIIHDNEVSREHCRLVRVLDDYELHDLGSTNGTFVNGQRIDSRAWLLSSRQIIELGDSITLEYIPAEDVSATRGTALIEEEESDYYLVIKRPAPNKARILPLRDSSLTVGRATDNDISINVPEMSRHHLRLVRRGNNYIAEDLNSTNGTILNGEKLTEQHTLESGDALQIGESLTIIFTSDPAHASRPPESLSASISTHNAKTENLTTRQPNSDKRRTTALVNATSPLGVLAPDANMSQVGHGLQPNQLLDHVMIVYARTEWRSRASKVFTYLQDRHVRVWTDQYLLPSSQDWQLAFDQAMFECRALLVVLSKQSIVQDHVKRAIRYFQAKEKAIALLQYGDIPQKPIIIAQMDTVNFDDEYPANSYEQVIATIQRLAPLSTRPPAQPGRTDPPTKKPADDSAADDASVDGASADSAPVADPSSKIETEPSSVINSIRAGLKAGMQPKPEKVETEETPSVKAESSDGKAPANDAKSALNDLKSTLDQLEEEMQDRSAQNLKGYATQTSEQVSVSAEPEAEKPAVDITAEVDAAQPAEDEADPEENSKTSSPDVAEDAATDAPADAAASGPSPEPPSLD